ARHNYKWVTFISKLNSHVVYASKSKAVFNPYPYAAVDKAPTQQLPTHEASVSRQGIPGELGLELDSAVQGVQDNVRPTEAEVVIDVEREGVCGREPGVEGRVFREGLVVLSLEEVAGDGRVLEGVEPRE
nr:hypothetical protein [Tanacetum cinerariifolium]